MRRPERPAFAALARKTDGFSETTEDHHPEAGPRWDFSKIPAYGPGQSPSPPPLPLQRKLAVGSVDDPLEHEADRVADQVMRMPDWGVATASAPPQVSRRCDACEEEEKLQKKEAGPQAAAGEAPASVHAVLRAPGQPLDAATRVYFEPRFGRDFSGVRLHTGAAAAQSARDVNAHAYTVGHNIVFGAGGFAPGTQQAQRLLAHELTHVAQQEAAVGPHLQRQPAPDVNKSAKFIEEQYRTGARYLQDPTLSEAAFNVRQCREQGGYYCEILVTDDDINSMYAEWTLIEDVFDRDTANKAIVDHKLHEVASGAAAEVKKRQAATGQYGVAAGGLIALKPFPVSAPVPPTSAPLPYLTPLAAPANENVPLGAAGPRVAAVAIPVAVVVFGIIVAVQLWKLGEFQRKLWGAGYKFLPSPRGVCMRECHQGTRNLPRTFDLPEPITLEPLNPLGPLSGPLSPGELKDIEEWLNPIPRLDPAEKERRRREKDCIIYPTFPRGGAPEHDALAKFVTGQPVEYLVITPEVNSKQYDGMDSIGTLYDVKTRHDWLAVLGRPAALLTAGGAWRIATGVGKLREDAIYERDVAQRCGHAFHLATNNRQAAREMREVLGDILSPEEIEYVEFVWRE